MTYETVTISSPGGETSASFVPALNMVCCSLVHRGIERLALRRGLDAYAELGKTLGIPLLYPWANRLDHFGYEAAGKKVSLSEADGRIPLDSQGLPIHGVLPSLVRWEPLAGTSAGTNAGTNAGALDARLSWSSRELLELFPYSHEAGLHIEVGDGQLVIATTILATDEDRVPVSFGYHPYLRVGSVPRDTWLVDVGATRRMLLDERSIPTGEREPLVVPRIDLGAESWDAAFDGVHIPARFSAAAGGLEMSVTFRAGYEFAQVFAPAEADFICLEPMTAATNALNSGDGLRILAPGERHHAEFAISIRDA